MDPRIILEQFDNAGFLRRGRAVKSAIQAASLSDILDFSQQSCELTTAKDLSRDPAIFSQSASLSLGGSRWPCSNFDCRLERAQQLAQYAALYGDRIYVRNFFADHVEHLDPDTPPDEDSLRRRFGEDIRLLAYLRPLIKAGRILLITPPNYCLHCLSKHSLGLADERPLKKAMRSLASEIERNITAQVYRIGNGPYVIAAEGPEDLLDHGNACYMKEEPLPGLRDMPRIQARVDRGEKVTLSPWALHKTGYAGYLAHMHHRSIFFELAMAQCLGTGFLTEMPVHIRFLKDLSLAPPNVERDLDVERHLTSLVPFAKELTPSEILRLRKQDEDAFVLFKAALANAVEEYRRNYGSFSEKDAKALYADVIKPELSRLEVRIQKARRSLIKGTTRKVLAWTAAISAGVYTGFVPQGLLAAAAALGLVKVLADFTENLMKNSDTTESVRDHDMYFLWRVKKQGRAK